jgi:hypothetical protein
VLIGPLGEIDDTHAAASEDLDEAIAVNGAACLVAVEGAFQVPCQSVEKVGCRVFEGAVQEIVLIFDYDEQLLDFSSEILVIAALLLQDHIAIRFTGIIENPVENPRDPFPVVPVGTTSVCHVRGAKIAECSESLLGPCCRPLYPRLLVLPLRERVLFGEVPKAASPARVPARAPVHTRSMGLAMPRMTVSPQEGRKSRKVRVQ